MRARRSLLAEAYVLRNRHPEIARAFSRADVEAETIAGQPSLGSLMDDPRARGFRGCAVDQQVKAIRGVTVECAVIFLDDGRKPLAEVRWKAGEGTSFRRLRTAN